MPKNTKGGATPPSKAKKVRSVTLYRQLYQSSMLSTVVALVMLVAILAVSGTINRLDDYAFSTMINTNVSQANQTSQTLAAKGQSLWYTRSSVQNKLDGILAESGKGLEELWSESDSVNAFLNDAYTDLERFIASENVTGAFVIMDQGRSEDRRPAVYLRSPSPGISVLSKKNLMLLWGSPRLPNLSGLPLEQNWSNEWSPSADPELTGFYDMPLAAFKQMPDANVSSLGYWCVMPALNVTSEPILVYSVPLVTENGLAFGVMGFEISFKYLSSLLPSGDVPFTGSFYAMGQISNGSIIKKSLVSNDSRASAYFVSRDDYTAFSVVEAFRDSLYTIKDGGRDMYLTFEPLELYSPNSPFTSETWHMLAFTPTSVAREASRSMLLALSVTLLASLAAALVISFFISRSISRRIEAAAAGVIAISGRERMISLPKTSIREIDDILATVESMSGVIARNAAKMSSIVDLMGLSIGVFEVDTSSDMVYMTKSMSRILEMNFDEDRDDADALYVPLDAFEDLLPEYKLMEPGDGGKKVFPYESKNTKIKKWLELSLEHSEEGSRIFGAVTDVTERVRENERLIYENTYDTLTRLLNRSSYLEKIKGFIAHTPDACGVMIFADLDCLKTVNDKYGHNAGDKYLQLAGNAFAAIERLGGIAARISGDEFVIYLHGGANRSELRERIDEYLELARGRALELLDGSSIILGFSAGLAYYPDDSTDAEMLVKFADFAMYEVKQSSKGSTHEFNRFRYERNSDLNSKASYLSSLIRERNIKYAFQPVVELDTCRIVSYEAVMRSVGSGDYSPGEILEQARNEGRMYDLELLLFDNFCLWVQNERRLLTDTTISFNTISDQYIADTDFYASYEVIRETVQTHNITIVMEISASSFKDIDLMRKKITRARENGMHISLDNYSGNNNEKRFVSELMPEYIKINIDTVRDIQVNYNKQRLVREIARLAAGYGITVIAEGIETYRELAALLNLGINYGQGFFFCPPEFTMHTELPEYVAAEVRGAVKERG